MKNAGPLATALAALIVALAAWLGFDLDRLSSGAGQPRPDIAGPPAPSRETRPEREGEAPPAGVPTGSFDYYVLALSWSPSYCATEASARDALQCEAKPHAFIVHGLWPQNERGYPEDCPTDNPRVPDALADEMLDIMPSRGLVGHQWRTHGACTGLTQEAYFAEVRAAFEAVALPPRFEAPDRPMNLAPGEVAAEFARANPEMPPGAVVVTCDGDLLDEVRICLSKDRRFRDCGRQSRRGACRRDRINVPPPEPTR